MIAKKIPIRVLSLSFAKVTAGLGSGLGEVGVFTPLSPNHHTTRPGNVCVGHFPFGPPGLQSDFL